MRKHGGSYLGLNYQKGVDISFGCKNEPIGQARFKDRKNCQNTGIKMMILKFALERLDKSVV